MPTQQLAPSLSLYCAPEHDPLLLINYPGGVDITLVNATHMLSRPVVPAQRAVTDPDTEAEAAAETSHASDSPNGRLHRNMQPRDRAPPAEQTADIEDTEDEEETTARYTNPRTSGRDDELDTRDLDDSGPPASDDEDEEDGSEIVWQRTTGPPPPMVRGWVLRIPGESGGVDQERVMASAMGHGGQVVAAVGTRSTLWIWTSDR